MNENGNPLEDRVNRGRVFFDKALRDLHKKHYSNAEFYIQAALKEDPGNPEYQTKLEEVRRTLTLEREETGPERGGECPSPVSAPSGARAEKKKEKAAKPAGKKSPGLPGGSSKAKAALVILLILLGGAIAYSVYSFIHPKDSRVNIADIKKTYGIELRTASVGEGKLQGFITGAWNEMPRAERELKAKQLFQDFRRSRGIKTLILWDENYSTAAEVSESAVVISP